METEQKTETIGKRLAGIMLEAKAIGKDSRNAQQGFNFRGIDAVMNHLHPIFAKHGVVILPNVIGERTEERQTKSGGNLIYRILNIRFDFLADDGSSASCTVIGEGMDTGDKAANKAMAVALKYALTQMLLLPYDEVDADATTPEPSKPVTKPVAHVSGDMQVAEVVLGEVKRQHGTGKKGSWMRTYSKADDGEFYSTFDTKLGQMLEELAHKAALLNYIVMETPKGVSREVLDVRPVERLDAGEQAAESGADEQRKGQAEMPF